MFKLRFSHNNSEWYEYGADANHAGHIFTDRQAATKASTMLIDTGLAQYTRIGPAWSMPGAQCQCATCSFARKHAEGCTCGCQEVKKRDRLITGRIE